MKTILLASAAVALSITPACAQYRTFPTPQDMRPGVPYPGSEPTPLPRYQPLPSPSYNPTPPPAFGPFGERQYVPNPAPSPFGPWR